MSSLLTTFAGISKEDAAGGVFLSLILLFDLYNRKEHKNNKKIATHIYSIYDKQTNNTPLSEEDIKYVESHVKEHRAFYTETRRRMLNYVNKQTKQFFTTKSQKKKAAKWIDDVMRMEYILSWRPREEQFLVDNKHIIDKIVGSYIDYHHAGKRMSTNQVIFIQQHTETIRRYCEIMIRNMNRVETRYKYDQAQQDMVLGIRFSVDELCSLLQWEPTYTWQTIPSVSGEILSSKLQNKYKTISVYIQNGSDDVKSFSKKRIMWKKKEYTATVICKCGVITEIDEDTCRLDLFGNKISLEHFIIHHMPDEIGNDVEYQTLTVKYMIRELKNGKKTINQLYAPPKQ